MTNKGNSYNNYTQKFLKDLELKTSIDSISDKISGKCKFNFSYFDNNQPAGQDFHQWTHKQLYQLLDKLKSYSKESLLHWTREGVGGGKKRLHILEFYHSFPLKSKTDFKEPAHIPHQVEWGRFRLEQKVRLIGFRLPKSYESAIQKSTRKPFDTNTFYVVFLDQNHKFYKTEIE